MAIQNDIEILFKPNYSRMHSLATAMLHDSEAAHDIVHDVFVSLLNNPTASSISGAYLLASVRNHCLNRIKAMEIRERFRNLYLAEFDEADEFTEWPDEEMLRILSICESQLSPQCLDIFHKRFRQGLSVKEIAANLEIGERMIYKHLRHALTILKNLSNGQS